MSSREIQDGKGMRKEGAQAAKLMYMNLEVEQLTMKQGVST